MKIEIYNQRGELLSRQAAFDLSCIADTFTFTGKMKAGWQAKIKARYEILSYHPPYTNDELGLHRLTIRHMDRSLSMNDIKVLLHDSSASTMHWTHVYRRCYSKH